MTVLILIIVFVVICLAVGVKQGLDEAKVKPGRDAQILCPHCQHRGSVTSKAVTQKKGISGGKATGAVLTGGISMLATGLSRKENVVQLRCRNCGVKWYA